MSASDLRRAVASMPALVRVSDDGGAVHLDLLSVPRELRGRGHARQALGEITEWADRTGTQLGLIAAPELGSDLRRLVGLYGLYGFAATRVTAGGDVAMHRMAGSAIRGT